MQSCIYALYMEGPGLLLALTRHHAVVVKASRFQLTVGRNLGSEEVGNIT